MDNLGLFTIFRILNDMRPRRILEFGLGQTSKLTQQYAAFPANRAAVLTVEHDQEWIDFFSREVHGYDLAVERHDLRNAEIGGAETVVYDGMERLLGGGYDFILVDGPKGQPRFSRAQILDFVRAGLPERFCVLLDDTERPGEQETLAAVGDILQQQSRPFLQKTYTGEKNSHTVICSPGLQFLTSL